MLTKDTSEPSLGKELKVYLDLISVFLSRVPARASLLRSLRPDGKRCRNARNTTRTIYCGTAVLEHIHFLREEGIKVAPLTRLVEVRPKEAVSISLFQACESKQG